MMSNSPTLSAAATQQGVILGTAAYMSPEQAKGKAVDKRADIWAFGVVLFEMLAGRHLFEGETVSETLAAVLMREPDFSAVPPNLHPRMRLLLERCLEKEPKNRYGAINDARVDIEKALADPAGVLVQPAAGTESKTRLRTILPWLAATAILSIIVAGMAVWRLKPSEPKQTIRFEHELREGRQFNSDEGGFTRFQMAVSPDGSKFVYGTTDGLYLRSMNALDAGLIAGTDKDSVQPFFSPDGQWIGYFSESDQKLKKVAISGGAPVVLCDAGISVVGVSWDTKDAIVYSDTLHGIMQVSANGGIPESLIKRNYADAAKEGFPAYPQMLADRKTLLFTNINRTPDRNGQIVARSLESGEQKVLVKGGFHARYLPTGHIVYALSNNLFAVPFDLDKLEVTGGSVSVLEGVRGAVFSDSGALVYVPQPASAAGTTGTASFACTLVWVDRQGKEEPLGASPDAYEYLRISPDGSKVALSIAGGNRDIWVWDILHKTPTKLTFDKADDIFPLWTPDGKRILFSSRRTQSIYEGIYWKSADGIGEDELIVSKQDQAIMPWSFTSDGKILALHRYSVDPRLEVDIGMLPMEGNREMKMLLQEKHLELQPQISPDGRWMAYQSHESGKGEIFVRSFPDVTKGKWQVSTSGGNSPLWSPDGRELFYRSGDTTIAVDVETGPAFKHGNPKILFRGMYLSGTVLKIVTTPWDIHPNGKKFLMIKPPASAAGESAAGKSLAAAPQPKIIVVTNWFAELKQRVPLK